MVDLCVMRGQKAEVVGNCAIFTDSIIRIVHFDIRSI